MKCRETRNLMLSDYMDGELSAEEAAKVEKHVSECQECRAYLSAVRFTAVKPFSQISQQAVPEFVWNNIKVALNAKAEAGHEGIFDWLKIHKMLSAGVSIAAVFLVAAGIFVGTAHRYSAPVAQTSSQETLYVESFDVLYGMESTEKTGFVDSAGEYLS